MNIARRGSKVQVIDRGQRLVGLDNARMQGWLRGQCDCDIRSRAVYFLVIGYVITDHFSGRVEPSVRAYVRVFVFRQELSNEMTVDVWHA